MQKITFLDLQLHQYTETDWMNRAKTQWKELPHSKFPSFAGKEVHRINNTVYYALD